MKFFKKLFGKPTQGTLPEPVKEEYGLPPLHAPPPEIDPARPVGASYYDRDTKTYYIKQQVDDHYMWIINQEEMDKAALREAEQIAEKVKQEAETKYKQELATALQTRVITDEEMLKVMAYGTSLFSNGDLYSVSGYGNIQYIQGVYNISSTQYYDTINYLQRAFNEAILQQFRLRTVKEAVKVNEIVQATRKPTNTKAGKPTKRKALIPY